jgi:hypothetical protein
LDNKPAYSIAFAFTLCVVEPLNLVLAYFEDDTKYSVCGTPGPEGISFAGAIIAAFMEGEFVLSKLAHCDRTRRRNSTA